jgi:hypothetical protein
MHTPPGLDWFDLIKYYAFRFVLLISFLYTLHQVFEAQAKGIQRFKTRKGEYHGPFPVDSPKFWGGWSRLLPPWVEDPLNP